MKTYILFLAFISQTIIFGQSKELKKALSDGPNIYNRYVVNFDKPAESDKIEKWVRAQNMVLVHQENGSEFRFGEVYSGVVRAEFMTKSDYNYMIAEQQRRQREQELLAREESNASLGKIVGAALVAGAVVYAGAKALSSLSDSGSSSYSSSGYSYSSKSYDDKSSSKTETKTIAPVACVRSDEARGEAYLRCSAKVKDTYYRVKCGDGTEKFYWYNPIKNSDLICDLKPGYYTAGLAAWETSTFLSTNKEEALLKLCNCQH